MTHPDPIYHYSPLTCLWNKDRKALLHLLRHQIAPNRKHFPRNPRREPIHLSRILLHLPRIQQHLQPPRLLRQLEQSLPLILRQGRLLVHLPHRILAPALLLPGGDFGLLAREGARVVAVVVEFGVVGFDGVEQVVARLGEEGVDAEGEGGEVGGEGAGLVGGDFGEGVGDGGGGLGGGGGGDGGGGGAAGEGVEEGG